MKEIVVTKAIVCANGQTQDKLVRDSKQRKRISRDCGSAEEIKLTLWSWQMTQKT